MKKTIFTLAMLCCAIVGNAQVTDEQSAILQVGDNAQIFYGADALIEAMAAAPDRGATITLSSGTFNAAEITKCVNIYGAGWVTELSPKNNDNPADNSILPTIINNTTNINLPAELAAPHNIHIEGIKFNGSFSSIIGSNPIDGLEVVKCYFTQVGANGSGFYDMENKNVHFTQCCITTGIFCAFYDMTLQNCYLSANGYGTTGIGHSDKEGSNLIFNHCILWSSNGGSNNRFICNNSIVSLYKKRTSQIYRYCIMTDAELGADFLGSVNNWFGISWADVFKDQANLDYSDTRTFELVNPAVYVGDDGTQVGVNGGNYPWNKAPHTPLVTDLKLAIDGTNLKVTYNAETR